MWPFSKKQPPEPPEDKRVWNEDWQVGDIAECIAEPGRWNVAVEPWNRPRLSQRLTVSGFIEGKALYGNYLAYFLKFSDWPVALETRAFRKVRPIAREEEGVVERILNAKPGRDVEREPETIPTQPAPATGDE